MKNFIYPATLLCDFYKVSHREQYPTNTKKIYSTWTPRKSMIKEIAEVVNFGEQAFAKEYLIDYFNTNFFERPLEDVITEYERVLRYGLNKEVVDSSHIKALHNLGYLPIKICAIKEGLKVRIKTPILTIENTLPEFFWITNYLETLFSTMVWQPMTSATLAYEFRKKLNSWAMRTVGNTNGVEYQGHDFAMRGMGGLDSAKSSGAGHLLSFIGTDTIPSILYFEEFYNANMETEMIGCSIPATEHSVHCAYGRDELATYDRLITKVYPKGFVSVVSDTWNIWEVLRGPITILKDKIMARDGRVIIRPDSGIPVDIMCGDPNGKTEDERKGVVEILWEIGGGTITEKGFKLLDTHFGAIYGDEIDLATCEEINQRLHDKGFASLNVVYGIGSFTYQNNIRDTFGFALKTTYGIFGDEEKFLYKDPITDSDKFKKSQTGKVVVFQDGDGLGYKDGLTQAQYDAFEGNLLEEVFVDGKLLRDQSLSEIRKLLLG